MEQRRGELCQNIARSSVSKHNQAYLTIFIFFFVFLFLPSCTFYPHYQRPPMKIPENWRVSSDETETVCNIRWWEQLNDPVLDELILEALESNNDLRAATARIAQFRAQLGIVSSKLYPEINAQGFTSRSRFSRALAGDQVLSGSNSKSKSAGNSYGGGKGGGGNGNGNGNGTVPDLDQLFPVFSNDYRAVFKAAYELDLWGKVRSATAASLAELLGQEDARRTVILSVVTSVAESYILLRQYDQQLQVSRQTVESRRYSYDLAKLRFDEGLTSELEVVQSLADLDFAMIQVVEFETRIPKQENLISILIGHPPHAIQRGRTVDGWQLPQQIPAGLPSDLLEQRPDIAEAEEQLKAANFKIGEARALYFPDVTLTGFYGNESAELHRLFTGPSNLWQWMANVVQPIFTGWRITSTVDLAKAEKQEAVYHYIETVLIAFKEVDDALIAHKNAKEVVDLQSKRVKDLKVYLDLATLQYDNGLVDYLNVLDAERRLFEAQLSLAQDQANVFMTLVDVYKALGGGWVVDAEQIMEAEWTAHCDCESPDDNVVERFLSSTRP